MSYVAQSDDDGVGGGYEDGEQTSPRQRWATRVEKNNEYYQGFREFPRLLKLYSLTHSMNQNVEPEDYLGAIAELLVLSISGSFFITWCWDKITGNNRLGNNPIINMVGYNNPCAFWDQPPAIYFASLMFCPMVYMGIRYSVLDTMRAEIEATEQAGAGAEQWNPDDHTTAPTLVMKKRCRFINQLYAISQCLVMGIFVVTPAVVDEETILAPEELKSMHMHMRLHSALFLQFVPILCITMAANYVEGWFSPDPDCHPTPIRWAVLALYVLATMMETVFATYAIFAYEGDYKFANREAHFVLPPWFMQCIDYTWFFSLPFAAANQPPAPNVLCRYRVQISDDSRPADLEDGHGEEEEVSSPGD